MKPSVTEQAIATINKKIDALEAAKQHILEAHEAMGLGTPDADAPKVRKTRKKKGLPTAEPPASEANHRPERL